jgi:hypothetical protein
MTSAVFSSTGQALHVSFLMEVLPMSQKGGTQLVIESLKRRYARADDHGPGSLNADGLSPIELRGQCAMVRGSVDHHLTEPERAAVWARHGHQVRKATGVVGLSAYLAPLVAMRHGDALRALTWSVFAPLTTGRDRRGRAADWTLRKIERAYGVPKSTLHDARLTLRHHAHYLERAAEARLQELFERTGLIEVNEEIAA